MQYLQKQADNLSSSHKKHRSSIEMIYQRIRQQNKCRLPKHQQIYLESIRQNNNQQKIPIKVNSIPWDFRNHIIAKTITWHRQLKLNKSVLFDSIINIDRYISQISSQQASNQYQAIVLSILYLCYKRQQKRRKTIKNWMETIQFFKYSSQQIIEKELQILQCFDYNLQYTNSFDFMSFLTIDMEINENTFMLARYFLQIAFFLNYSDFYDYINYQGLLGATALYLSCYFLQPTKWNNYLRNQLNVTEQLLQDCASLMFELILQIDDNNSPMYQFLEPIHQKYMKKCYLQVASIKFQPAVQFQSIEQEQIQKEEIININIDKVGQQKDLACSDINTTISSSASHKSLHDSTNKIKLVILNQFPKKISCIKIDLFSRSDAEGDQQNFMKTQKLIQ